MRRLSVAMLCVALVVGASSAYAQLSQGTRTTADSCGTGCNCNNTPECGGTGCACFPNPVCIWTSEDFAGNCVN